MCIEFEIPPDVFFGDYQEKCPLLMKGVARAEEFCWRDVNELILRSDPMSPDFKLSLDGIRAKRDYVESYYDVGTLRHRLLKPVVYDFLRRGATLIVNKIKNEPSVEQFSRYIGMFTGRQVVNSAYVAFGTKDSFRCHWDTRDVFAIQLIGRKRWIIYKPSLRSPLYTQQSKDFEHLYPCPELPYMDVVLEPGDVFYLPRGWWHNPLPLGEPSFHLALGTFPPLAIDFLQWVVTRMEDVVAARASLSNWKADGATLASVGQGLHTAINDPECYRRFMDEYWSSTRTESTLAIELLGDPNSHELPDSVIVGISSNKLHCLTHDYLIANGAKVQLDAESAQLLHCIADARAIQLSDLIAKFPELAPAKIRHLVIQLCREDVLGLLRC